MDKFSDKSNTNKGTDTSTDKNKKDPFQKDNLNKNRDQGTTTGRTS